ncbi:MAG: hypothetical protein JNK21_10835 [Rhodospirillaceae bacterium]|nr:hypothetical protein [Rhodospirillaceae bacterium]
MSVDGPKIKGLLNYGSILHGEAIAFDLVLDAGNIRYHIDYSNLGMVLSQIHQAADLAQKHRNARGPISQDDLITPYRATSARTGVFADGAIAASFGTSLGLPVTIRLTPELTKKLIAALEQSLLDREKSSGPLKN